MTTRRAALAASAVSLIAVTLARTALASDKFDSTIDASVHAFGSLIDIDHASLATGLGVEAPQRIEDAGLELDGSGTMAGLRMRLNLSLDGFRIGGGIGVGHVQGPRLLHGALPEGWQVSHGEMWAVPVEGFVGYAFGEARSPRPYIELGISATYITTGITASAPEVGDLGEEPQGTWLPSVTPRFGVLVPLSEYFFLDVAVGCGLLKGERFGVSWGLGLPIPTANL